MTKNCIILLLFFLTRLFLVENFKQQKTTKREKNSWELTIFVVNFTLTRNRAHNWLSIYFLFPLFPFFVFHWLFILLIVSLQICILSNSKWVGINFTKCVRSSFFFVETSETLNQTRSYCFGVQHYFSNISIVQVNRRMITISIIFI